MVEKEVINDLDVSIEEKMKEFNNIAIGFPNETEEIARAVHPSEGVYLILIGIAPPFFEKIYTALASATNKEDIVIEINDIFFIFIPTVLETDL